MKRKTILLIALGTLCISLSLLTRHFFTTPKDLGDFLVGLGTAFNVSSLFVQKKLERKSIH